MKIRYLNTIEDVVAFARIHSRYSPTHRWARLLLRWVIPGVILLLTPVMVPLDDLVLLLIWCAPAVLLMVGTGWLLDVANVLTTRAHYRAESNKALLCQHELELVPPNLIDRSSVGEQTTRLAVVERVVSTPTHTFIFITTLSGHVIPRAAVSEGDYEGFVQAVTQEVQRAKSQPVTPPSAP